MEGQHYLSELLAVAAVPIVVLAQRLWHGKLQQPKVKHRYHVGEQKQIT